MSNQLRRWLVPLVAAIAVLAVVGVVWAQRPGATGDDIGFAGGGDAGSGDTTDGDPGQGSPPDDGTDPGTPGIAPMDPPSDDPGEVPAADRGSIAVDSFYRYDATHLALNYTNGVPECYGDAGTPRVEETADAVVVTIPRTPVKSDGDMACIEIALLGTVDITLSSPLGDRVVLDGARDRTQVDEAAAPNDANQAS